VLLIDCETDQSAFETTSGALGIEPEMLLSLLHDLRSKEDDDSAWQDPGNPEGLLNTIEFAVGRKAQFDGVCYFHFTRVLPHERFEEGILPGIDRLPKMWEILKTLTS